MSNSLEKDLAKLALVILAGLFILAGVYGFYEEFFQNLDLRIAIILILAGLGIYYISKKV